MSFFYAAIIAIAASANSVIAQHVPDAPSAVIVYLPEPPIYAGKSKISKPKTSPHDDVLQSCLLGNQNSYFTIAPNSNTSDKVPTFYAFNFYIIAENGTAVINSSDPMGESSYGRSAKASADVYMT